MRERWLQSIYKEIENFLQNMAIDDADPALVVAWKQKGKWPLPCQIGICPQALDTVTAAGE